MKFVCTSDTHGKHGYLTVPDGDVFLFTGDLSDVGREDELVSFNQFLGNLLHRYKIVISGNHDLLFELDHGSIRTTITNAICLENSEVVIEGIRIWGSSWNPKHFKSGPQLEGEMVPKSKWDLIPAGIDILLTHEPPLGHGSVTTSARQLGSADLLDAIRRVKPKYHVFGHVHEGHGIYKEYHDGVEITCINASAIIDFGNELRPPVVFELPKL
ncbi:MAG: metallophosphatase domain-containing protein [Candidatus Odinarchaeota archaeon]